VDLSFAVVETDPVTIVLRDENGDEWRVTDSSPADSGPFVLRIDGPEGDSLQVNAQTRDEFRARLRRMLNDRPDVLALVPWLLKH
jgi:hypothetical protein